MQKCRRVLFTWLGRQRLYCGKGVAFFDEMPVSEAAANIVFDALAQSKSGLVPPATCDERIAPTATMYLHVGSSGEG